MTITIFDAVTIYRREGFIPFPLAALSKEPLSESKLSSAENLAFSRTYNIGIFAGSKNGLVIVDADSPQSQENVTVKLKELGLYDWTTVVHTPKRGGRHFWLRVVDLPPDRQAYYKLDRSVGGGELRSKRPAYVVAPPSKITEGEYLFMQGGVNFFNGQPGLKWADLDWLVPGRLVRQAKVVDLPTDAENPELLTLPHKRRFYPKPSVLRLFPLMRQADGSGRVARIDYRTGELTGDYFDTRSEAEAAIVTGLVMSGWGFDHIEARFEKELPSHYAEVSDPRRYLVQTYNSSVRYITYR